MKLGSLFLCLACLLALPAGNAASAQHTTITCPYLKAAELKFAVPEKLGDLPEIDFFYPSKATLFVFRKETFLVVAIDQDEPSRVRIVISAQRNRARGTYDGQIVVDMGGNEIQLYNGPVSCRASR